MDCRLLEMTLCSADIKDVNLCSKMDVYAVVSISGAAKLRTPVHKDSGTNPKWNHSFKFTLYDSALQQDSLKLKIKLISVCTHGETKIGKAVIPVKELLQNFGKDGRHVTYAVVMPKGKPKGTVCVGYKFGDKFSVPLPVPPQAHEPVMANPAGHRAGSTSAYPPPGVAYPPLPQPGYGYPPQQPVYGYAPPPQAGYGYPRVVQPGYGYPPQRGGGGNMALGLGAGLLGGLLIGDMVDDVGGFDDGFGSFDDGFGVGFVMQRPRRPNARW